MPVVNDVPGAWEAIRAEGERLGRETGIQKELFWGFFNTNGRFPQNLQELVQWGNTPDRIYGIRRRQDNGDWAPIMPGPNPMRANLPPGTADGTRGAWAIQNAEDSDVERYKDFNPAILRSFGQPAAGWRPTRSAQDGRVQGGPRLRAQGVGGQPVVYETTNGPRTLDEMIAELRPTPYKGPWDETSVMQQYAYHIKGSVTGPSADLPPPGGEAAAAGDGVRPTPSGVGWMSVVGGDPRTFGDEAQARADYASRTAGGPASPAPSASPGGTAPTSPGATPPAQAAPGASAPGNDPGRVALVDANAYGNTQTLQAQIDDAIRRYALARTTEERNQAYLDLQRWQTELGKAEGQQKRYDAMAQALLSASVQLQNNPRDYFKFNQYTSGGRDIFNQMQGAGPAFAGPTGPIEPGSVNDLIQRLGIQPSQPLPATPAGVLPGAANPKNPELPYVPVPGAVGGPPGALQSGAGGSVPAAAPTGLPAYEQMLAELDRAAGGQWAGNRADRPTVAREWWNANPSRRGQPMPAWS